MFPESGLGSPCNTMRVLRFLRWRYKKIHCLESAARHGGAKRMPCLAAATQQGRGSMAQSMALLVLCLRKHNSLSLFQLIVRSRPNRSF